MGASSAKMYIPESEEELTSYQQNKKVNANVIYIGFSMLKDVQNIALGDPIFCKKCVNALNKMSKIQLIQADQQDKLWICEFCGYENYIKIEEEEIPKTDDTTYVLNSISQIKQNQAIEQDITIIFCIDNSGSMSVTTEVSSDVKFKRNLINEEELEQLKQYMEPWEFQQYKNQSMKQEKNYISRKNCVLAAIENQLKDLKKNFPNRKIGLVIFNSEVCVIGDGFQQPLIITGQKLNNYDVCLEEGKKCATSHLQQSVTQSGQNLINQFEKFEEKGSTALGPALIASLGLLSESKPGSKLIMCTDGLANIGIGNLDTKIEADLQKAQEEYKKMGEYAQTKGIAISTITMKGEECNVLVLGQLGDMTNGQILRVNPGNIQNDFANVMKEEILATNVRLKVQAHRGIEFKNLDQECIIDADGSSFDKKIGNVTENTTVTFEYDIKNIEKLQQQNIIIKDQKSLPFQAQIYYTSQDGNSMIRIISKMQEVSKDHEQVKKISNIDILAKHANTLNSRMALQGKLDEAKHSNQSWNDYIQNDLGKVQNSNENQQQIMVYQQKSLSLNNIIEEKTIKRVKKQQKANYQNEEQKIEEVDQMLEGTQSSQIQDKDGKDQQQNVIQQDVTKKSVRESQRRSSIPSSSEQKKPEQKKEEPSEDDLNQALFDLI